MLPIMNKYFLAFILAVAMTGCATPPKKVTKDDRLRMILNLANASLGEGNPVEALRVLGEIELEAPEYPEIHHSKALAYYQQRDISRALESAKRAVQLYPNYIEANTTLGKIYLDQGRLKEAEAPLLKAAQESLNPQPHKANSLLGMVYYRQEMFAEASMRFTKAIEQSPDDSCVARYYMGHLSLRTLKYADAIKNYSSATKGVCGGFAEAHFALGVAYTQSGQYALARKKFVEIKQLFPDTQVAMQAVVRLRDLP
jgi:Flp pilus assembly protein TadD